MPENTVNGGRSNPLADTPVTHARSPDVHALTTMRADLLDMRKRHHADSPIHHRCENLRQMFLVYANAYGDEDRRAQLEKNIRRQMADLVGLTGGVQ